MVVLPKCGTNPRPSDDFNESHGSENSDSDAVDTALALRWNKTSPGFPENERNSQKAVDLSCSSSSEVASSKQNISTGIGENKYQVDRRNLDRSETEHPCQESGFSSYGGIGATNNSRSENGADKNGIEISSAIHGYSLSNSRSENGTDLYGDEPSLSLREHPQDNNNLNPGPLPDIDDIDHSLIFTCEGRCGEKLSFPCSCTATCVVYGSCCNNITQDCPEVWQEGWARFEHITRADLVCDENLVYQISSCPGPVKEAVIGGERWLANSKKPMLKKVNVSSPSSSDLRGPVMDNHTTTTVCLSTVYDSFVYQPGRLSCMEDPVYERDWIWLNDFRNSTCFSHLESLRSDSSSSAISVIKRHGMSFAGEFSFHALAVSAVFKAVTSLTI
ncbi:hypothetical protein PoB_003761400 [Plakobranchus ocellatus]|uniref:SMB domain-containing protein n=1 Tax=Plakobranchus ocellatus TaxID=259542 RepID=A0AAV4AXK5_9GAST|nr:hypothetical protein PoB_003761400 [Plakobranchus ocellatus]